MSAGIRESQGKGSTDSSTGTRDEGDLPLDRKGRTDAQANSSSRGLGSRLRDPWRPWQR